MKFVVVALTVVLSVGGCSKQSVTQTDQGVFVLGSVEESESTERGITPGGRTIVLEGFSGDIMLRGVSSETATFAFTRKARANDSGSAAKLLQKIAISETGDESVFAVTMTSPEPERTAVDINAEIPVGTPVTIVTRFANVSVQDINGDISIRNEAGSIEYSGAAQDVEMKSRNGDLTVNLSSIEATARLNLETSNGDVFIAAPVAANVDIDAVTSAGVVRNTGLDFATTSLALSGAGGHFTGRVGMQADARLMARTFHGDITFGAFAEASPPDTPEDENVIDDVPASASDSLVIPADESNVEMQDLPQIP